MQTRELGTTGLSASRIVQGCMRFDEITQDEVTALVAASLEAGINMFDNADIYGGGECEEKCGRALKALGVNRDDVIVQTKCGINHHMYDFSKQHILGAVDASLARLGLPYVDVLLLHRPDPLARPEEIAEAFDELYAAGKVRFFGVSNMDPMQVELVQKYIGFKLHANQLQFGPAHTGMVDSGVLVNTTYPGSIQRDGMVLDYCRLKDITVQAWSPYQKGQIEGAFLVDPAYRELNEALRRLALEKGTNVNAIVAAWILRHPADMQVIIGTTKPQRVKETCEAFNYPISHDEWYALYKAAGNTVP